MCNFLHINSRPIPKKGTGWKIFEIVEGEHNALKPVFKMNPSDTRTYPLGKLISWEQVTEATAGFCFFRSSSEANRAFKIIAATWSKSKFVLLPIHYEEGMGEHAESGMIDSQLFEIALCKKFRIGLEIRNSPAKNKARRKAI